MLLRKDYGYHASVLNSRLFARRFLSKLKTNTPDLIFAPVASVEIALLKTEIPIVYLSDATFSVMQDYYPNFKRLLGFSKREGNYLERLAIQKASAIIYPSNWAARSAVEDYGADQAKVHIVPFGANIDAVPHRDAILAKSAESKCKLLFLGRNWARKGGDIAIETLHHLRLSGVDAELTVCGCVPPHGAATDYVHVIPFLNKNDENQRRQLEALLLDHHFLVLPTRADCSPIVFCEAAAYGLPSVTTDTGGVSGVVQNGRNGFLMPLSARGDQYAALIRSIYVDANRYQDLIMKCRNAYDQQLNWDSWGKSASRIFEGVLAACRSARPAGGFASDP